jgi:hypothetical protein
VEMGVPPEATGATLALTPDGAGEEVVAGVGATVLVDTTVGGAVVVVGAAVVVMVLAFETVVVTGLTTVGALTAVVPVTLAPVTFTEGATVPLPGAPATCCGGALEGAATATLGLLADAAPPDLMAKTRARMRPISASTPMRTQIHQGQGSL